MAGRSQPTHRLYQPPAEGRKFVFSTDSMTMLNPSPVVMKCAFDLGRAENEFRWDVVNVILGGKDGATSLATLDRIGVGLESVAIGRQKLIRDRFVNFRNDWRQFTLDRDWKQAYSNALEGESEAVVPPECSPAERIVNGFLPYIRLFHEELDEIIERAMIFSGELVKTAHSLGMVMDQGIRPPISRSESESDDSGSLFRLPALRYFIRENANPDHSAWKRRRADWLKKSDGVRPFQEPEPPVVNPAPYSRQSGEFPPTTSWCNTLKAHWELVGIDSYRQLPESVENVVNAAPATRIDLTALFVRLAHAAFREMRASSTHGPQHGPDRELQTTKEIEEEFAAKLVGCSHRERVAYAQYQFAARRIAVQSTEPPTDAEVYQWLKNHSTEFEIGKLPTMDTWSRYVRTARGNAGENKNHPRGKRTARSSVSRDGADLNQPDKDAG